MKRLALTLVGALILALAACSHQPASSNESASPKQQNQSAAPAAAVETFTGQIMDSTCAAMGGHGQMGESEGAKKCTLECVKMGAKFVLYNGATKKTYQLDDQTTPIPFAGEEVKVTGTLNPSSDMIHVKSISAA